MTYEHAGMHAIAMHPTEAMSTGLHMHCHCARPTGAPQSVLLALISA